MGNLPDFSFEKKYWESGFDIIIGVDEVGRGSLSGPVAASAAALNIKYQNLKIKNNKEKIFKLGINDSKKLTPDARVKLSKIIPKYFYYAIGEASVKEINNLGIVKAVEKAMIRALSDLTMKQFSNEAIMLLVDGTKPIGGLRNKRFKMQKCIIKGDEKSITIASASIMAKVYRDKLMRELSKSYPHYKWEKNKGYGTSGHIISIRENGICREHRVKFVDGII